MPDPVDVDLLHALQIAPRAPLSTLADAIGVSEQTLARRYRTLLRDGAVRVVGLVNPAAHGLAEWVARISCQPSKVDAIAASLVRRPDVTYAHLDSGGTEIVCVLHAKISDDRHLDLPGRLSRSSGVVHVETGVVLHLYTESRSHWTAFGPPLGAEAVRRLTAGAEPPGPAGNEGRLHEDDLPLLEMLAEDGRTSYAAMAASTGRTVNRIRRRLHQLETAGTLAYAVDLLPERLGRRISADVRIRVEPRHLHAIGQHLARRPEVAYCAALSGEHNLLAVVICRDTAELYDFVTTVLSAVPGITGYTIETRARRLKQGASLIAYGRLTPPA